MSARVRTTLANLKPAPGSLHKQKRVGRGQGSGNGGTAGRGANGQKSRSGPGIKPGFEGGQTPITKLFPKRGFVNQNARKWAPVNLDRIQYWMEQGRLVCSPKKPITAKELLLSGCIHNVHDGVKILGGGKADFKTPIYAIVSRASKEAMDAIASNKGVVICKYYNDLALRDCVKGRTDRVDAGPTRREDIIWYGKLRNHGYLSPAFHINLGQQGTSHLVQERWKMLAAELGAWKKQTFDMKKKI